MADDDRADEPAASAPAGGLMKKLLLGGGAVALLAAGLFAGPAIQTLTAPPSGEATEVAAEPESAPLPDSGDPALYAGLHPPLVVNFQDATGDPHFMQIEMEIMARDPDVIDAVKNHTAVIRNNLILLYGNVDYDRIRTRAGKEKMLADGLAEVQAVMKERIGTPGVEALYFTSLIIQ